MKDKSIDKSINILQVKTNYKFNSTHRLRLSKHISSDTDVLKIWWIGYSDGVSMSVPSFGDITPKTIDSDIKITSMFFKALNGVVDSLTIYVDYMDNLPDRLSVSFLGNSYVLDVVSQIMYVVDLSNLNTILDLIDKDLELTIKTLRS